MSILALGQSGAWGKRQRLRSRDYEHRLVRLGISGVIFYILLFPVYCHS